MLNNEKIAGEGVANRNEASQQSPIPRDNGTNEYPNADMVDPGAALKEELIIAQDRKMEQRFNQMQQQMLEQNKILMSDLLASKQEVEEEDEYQVETSVNPILKPYRDEMETLGVDESQMMGMLSIVRKAMGTEVPKYSAKLKEEITEESRHAQVSQQSQQMIAAQYPDILKRDSNLWRESARLTAQYKEAQDPVMQSPNFTAMVIREAASNLGVQPVTLESIRSRDAVNPSGGGSVGAKKSNADSERMQSFADFFNVPKDALAKKMDDLGL
jgi:hypothetical protein